MKGLDYRKVRDEAASVGHIAHDLIECEIKGREWTWPEDITDESKRLVANCQSAFRAWASAHKFQPLHTEVRLVSERHQYGGRMDCLALVNGQRAIVDWKTGGTFVSHLVQIAGYRNLWEENHRGERVETCHLLRVRKEDGGFTHSHMPLETMDKAWRAFLVCRELYDAAKELKKLV